MMQGKSSPPMGAHKHGISGKAGKSPRFRHAMKREAEAQLVKRRKTATKWVSSVTEALHG
jgi:hypothetical protein